MSDIFRGADARPTRQDVAKLAKVSGTTVSRVLGGRPDESVSEKARNRVVEAARQLGYMPNPAAKALRSGRSGLIGFWMCLEYSRYRSQVLAEMRKILAPTEFAMAVNDVDEDYVWSHSIDRALRVPTEGIIAFEPSRIQDLDINIPFVSMGAFYIQSRSYVAVDLQAGTEEAMDHLIANGHRSIAYLAPRNSIFVTEGQRFEGYRRKMEEAGLPMQTIEVWDTPGKRLESIQEQLAERQAENRLPDALICFYDVIAQDAADALVNLGLKPGHEVAVVGYDGMEGMDRPPYPITTIEQPVEEMCRLALRYLQSQLENPNAPLEQITLKPKLVVRASSSRKRS